MAGAGAALGLLAVAAEGGGATEAVVFRAWCRPVGARLPATSKTTTRGMVGWGREIAVGREEEEEEEALVVVVVEAAAVEGGERGAEEEGRGVIAIVIAGTVEGVGVGVVAAALAVAVTAAAAVGSAAG